MLRIPYRQSAHGHHEAHITAHDDTTDIGHRCIDPHSCLRHKSRKALKYAAVRALPLHKALTPVHTVTVAAAASMIPASDTLRNKPRALSLSPAPF